MAGHHYPKVMASVRTGIELLTAAAFGTTFASRGRKYNTGLQLDFHSCGVCVINAIYAKIHGAEIFTAATRDKLRLEYFTQAAEYLLTRQVCPLPVGYSPTCSSFHRTVTSS